MTVDPFLLRGAELGAAWRAERGGAAGAVYHAVGGASLPIASDLPVVVTLLDLAPWELPEAFARSVASRFGQRLRSQLLRDAARVIVGSEATAQAARRLLRIRRDRLRVVPFAARSAFAAPASDAERAAAAALRARLGLGGALPGLQRAVRRPARPRDPPRARSRPWRRQGRPAGLAAGTPVAAAGARRRGEPRGSGRGRPPRGPTVASARRSPTHRACRSRTSPRSSAVPGRSSCRSSPRRSVCRPSRRSPRARRSWPQRSGRSPSWSGRPVCWWSRATPIGWPSRSRRSGPTTRVHRGLARAARDRAAQPPRTWAEVAADTRAVYAEVGIRLRG